MTGREVPHEEQEIASAQLGGQRSGILSDASESGKSMNINLHIERLVLDGLAITPEQRPVLQAAVEQELSRLLTERGLSPSLAQGVAVPRIATSGIQIGNRDNPIRLGQQIAQSVYGGIGHE